MYLPNELAHPIIIYPIILDISVRVRNLKKKIKKKKIRTSYFISMIERLIFYFLKSFPYHARKKKYIFASLGPHPITKFSVNALDDNICMCDREGSCPALMGPTNEPRLARTRALKSRSPRWGTGGSSPGKF